MRARFPRRSTSTSPRASSADGAKVFLAKLRHVPQRGGPRRRADARQVRSLPHGRGEKRIYEAMQTGPQKHARVQRRRTSPPRRSRTSSRTSRPSTTTPRWAASASARWAPSPRASSSGPLAWSW
ncbi:hypothetical protein QJS66_03475 [Kocuria rhizophila]|nr:hypothetical protein QJS66_03475 [Kocuria rhizophila]